MTRYHRQRFDRKKFFVHRWTQGRTDRLIPVYPRKRWGIIRIWVIHINPFPVFYMSVVQAFGKHCRKRIAHNKQFFLFPQHFLPNWRTFCHFHQNSKLMSASSFTLGESKICHLGKVNSFTTEYRNCSFSLAGKTLQSQDEESI